MNFFSPARPFTSTFILMLILIPGALLAQTTATIVGRITDQSGAAVVSGTVTVQNVQTGAERDATVNTQGEYTIPSLP